MEYSQNPITAAVEAFMMIVVEVISAIIVGLVEAIIIGTVGWMDIF